jgi:hypothetical protein
MRPALSQQCADYERTHLVVGFERKDSCRATTAMMSRCRGRLAVICGPSAEVTADRSCCFGGILPTYDS